MTPQQRKFKVAAHTCWADMAGGRRKVSAKSYGSCMKDHLKGHRKSTRKRRRSRR